MSKTNETRETIWTVVGVQREIDGNRHSHCVGWYPTKVAEPIFKFLGTAPTSVRE